MAWQLKGVFWYLCVLWGTYFRKNSYLNFAFDYAYFSVLVKLKEDSLSKLYIINGTLKLLWKLSIAKNIRNFTKFVLEIKIDQLMKHKNEAVMAILPCSIIGTYRRLWPDFQLTLVNKALYLFLLIISKHTKSSIDVETSSKSTQTNHAIIKNQCCTYKYWSVIRFLNK